jgi:hypothetical protein
MRILLNGALNLYNNILSIFFTNKIVCRSSELIDLGKLKDYTFEEIRLKLKKTQIKILDRNEDYFIVEFSDELTEIIIFFNTNGTFHHIDSEHWKDLDIKFKNNKIIYNE